MLYVHYTHAIYTLYYTYCTCSILVYYTHTIYIHYTHTIHIYTGSYQAMSLALGSYSSVVQRLRQEESLRMQVCVVYSMYSIV